MLHRSLGLIALCALAAGPAHSDELPRQDCSADFRSRWQADKEAASQEPLKQPCWMKTQSGPYVCYKDGCVRAHVYFGG